MNAAINIKEMLAKLDKIENHLGKGGMVYVPKWGGANPFPRWTRGQPVTPLIAAIMCQVEEGVVVNLTHDENGHNVAAMGWI